MIVVHQAKEASKLRNILWAWHLNDCLYLACEFAQAVLANLMTTVVDAALAKRVFVNIDPSPATCRDAKTGSRLWMCSLSSSPVMISLPMIHFVLLRVELVGYAFAR